MTQNKEHYLWCEKYRPTTLDTYIGNDTLKARVGRFIASGDVPHLLLSGPAGTGKTTAAKIISSNIECDVLYINASDENSVDTVRNKIRNFASSMGFNPLKIIILDEADYLSPNAQAALRNLMETFSQSTRFIMTCNYVERMLDAIISRTQQFQVIPPSREEVAKHVVYNILDVEGVTYALSDVKIILDRYYPDIRKVINELQLNTQNNELVVDEKEMIQGDFKLGVIDVLSSKSDAKKKFKEIRQILADAHIRDFTDMYSLLYNRVTQYGEGVVSECILAIAEGQYRDSFSLDKEINFMATIIQLLQNINTKGNYD